MLRTHFAWVERFGRGILQRKHTNAPVCSAFCLKRHVGGEQVHSKTEGAVRCTEWFKTFYRVHFVLVHSSLNSETDRYFWHFSRLFKIRPNR